MTALVAAIPPPPFSVFHIGPLTIRMYGIMIGLGVLAAVWLAGRLFDERGIGDIDDAASIAVWGVFAGIIGARFYHVVTDFQNFQGGNFVDAFKVWKPGLGIPGGIFFGTLAGVWAAKRRGIPTLPALSCAAPAIPLAQAIGRFGNYFNQELYGRPTTLPWGLEVSSSVNTGYPPDTLFHPTFLYESLWNFALCAALVWVFHHRTRLQPGRLFPLYMIGYGTGRLWIESLRIDPANKIGPFRTNVWMSLLLIVGGATWFIMTRDSTARWPHRLRVGGRASEGGDGSDDAAATTATATVAEAGRRATPATSITGSTGDDSTTADSARGDSKATDRDAQDRGDKTRGDKDRGDSAGRAGADDQGRGRTASDDDPADATNPADNVGEVDRESTSDGSDQGAGDAATDDGAETSRKRGATARKRSTSAAAGRAKRGARSHGARTGSESTRSGERTPGRSVADAQAAVDEEADENAADSTKAALAESDPGKKHRVKKNPAKKKPAKTGAEIDDAASATGDTGLAEAHRTPDGGDESANDD